MENEKHKKKMRQYHILALLLLLLMYFNPIGWRSGDYCVQNNDGTCLWGILITVFPLLFLIFPTFYVFISTLLRKEKNKEEKRMIIPILLIMWFALYIFSSLYPEILFDTPVSNIVFGLLFSVPIILIYLLVVFIKWLFK